MKKHIEALLESATLSPGGRALAHAVASKKKGDAHAAAASAMLNDPAVAMSGDQRVAVIAALGSKYDDGADADDAEPEENGDGGEGAE